MKRSILLSFLTMALMLQLAIAASAQTQLHGTWTMERAKESADKVYLNFSYNGDHQSGHDLTLSSLKGLEASTIDGVDAPAKFQLQREAGNIQFDGRFNRGVGHGDFDFKASPEYIAEMKKLGFSGMEKDAFALTLIDVTTNYAKELQSLGFHPDLEHLISACIFKVNREQVDGLKAAGITGLSLEKLVEFRIFKVTPEYVKEMRAKSPNITPAKLVESKIFQITPEFTNELAQAGYKDLSQDQLTAFRIHGVNKAFIQQMRDLGYKDLTADQLVEFRIFNVGPEQIGDLSKEGYSNLKPEELVAFRIHKIDSAFIERAKKAGYSHLTPDQLVELKITGLRRRDTDI